MPATTPMMSTSTPPGNALAGINAAIPAAANNRRPGIPSGRMKKPTEAQETSATPNTAVQNATATSTGSPINSRLGEYTKKTGTMKAVQPKRVAVKPVRIASALASEAAANAAIAIGGVIIDIMPKYIT